MTHTSRTYDALANLIVAGLTNVMKGEHVSRTTCMTIYQLIFNNVQDVMQASGLRVTNEGMNWIAQTFYDEIVLNDKTTLDPSIFTQRAFLSNIETHEVELLAVIFRGTPTLPQIMLELKKR